MQIVLPPSGSVLKILGAARPAESGLRWMTYVLTCPVEGGVLAFHTLTRAMLLLSPEEFAAPDAVSALRSGWFRVPQTLNDRSYADRVRFVLKTMRKKPQHITSYTIFPTTDCNARCFYCYELGRSRIPMSEAVARKTAAYIAAHCGGESVQLNWFGGEPLCNSAAIDTICSELAAKGVAYSSTMISNAYLFDDALVQKAVSQWRLRRIQITLDGTETVYNRSKAFVYRDGRSPYRVVTDNVGRLLNAGISVKLRLNIDLHNADDLLLLAGRLHERFDGSKGLTVYTHALYSHTGSARRSRTAEERDLLCRKQQALQERLAALGLSGRHTLRRSLPTHRCMADSGGALTVLPNGELGLCEQYSEDHFVGHLDRPTLDGAVLRDFAVERPPLADCERCFFYPECIRLKQCSEQAECLAQTRARLRTDTLRAMQSTYDAWLKKETDEGEPPQVC